MDISHSLRLISDTKTTAYPAVICDRELRSSSNASALRSDEQSWRRLAGLGQPVLPVVSEIDVPQETAKCAQHSVAEAKSKATSPLVPLQSFISCIYGISHATCCSGLGGFQDE